ncbi:hypothetical protein AJ78_08003 [Emergomyces pasteurianus Ep9510]|uniref:Uncharacterized protein n=1 Tax=Emergomyces pasteurianus Ep9510 TaxID=1447872 RepID=A0A1J9PTH0_9EURO|nr:hypothetical protein AJ78_08003 [Emergomyces pasteurianus Ep9510]
MAATGARAMGSTELHKKLGNPRYSINVADIRTTNIHPKYESEEEDMSEIEASGRTESVFSPIENDSDTGASELEEMNFDSPGAHGSYMSDDKFILQFPTCPISEAAISRAGSIRTVNRDSCITLMPPLRTQTTKEASVDSSTSVSTSLPLFPNRASEEEALQYFRSFFADTPVSSDDEDAADTPFLIATPISFYSPGSKPHLISIQQTAPQTSIRRTTTYEKPQEPSLFTREDSSKSRPSNASLRNRISGLKMGKYGKKRNSTQPASESTFHTNTRFSNASVHSLSSLSWRSSSVLSLNSESELNSSASLRKLQNESSSLRRHTLLPSPRMPESRSTDNCRQSRQIPDSRAAGSVKLEENIGRTHAGRTSRTKRKHNIPPVPQITGIAVSSDISSPTSMASSPDSPRSTPVRDQRLRTEPPFPSHRASRQGGSNHVKSSLNSSPSPISPIDRTSNFPFPDIPSSDLVHIATKRRGFHERTHSINSLASTTSMPNFASPDNSSPRSATHRYKQRFYPADAFPSDRPPSRESVKPAVKPNPRNTYSFAPRGSISTANLSNLSSVSTVAPRSNPRADIENLSWNYRTGTWTPSGTPGADNVKTPLRKQAQLKGIKRLYETSESVSRAGTKAFNGLGSILRKKHVTSADERWSSSRVV